MKLRLETLDWERHGGLLPAVVQHACSGKVLMLGYMNAEALERTLTERRVTFYSRSRQRLWTKGETSGNFLSLVDVATDCDSDTLLVQVLLCRGRPDISRESRLPVDARGDHQAADRGAPGRQLHRAPVRRRTRTDRAEARRGRRGARARGGEPRR